MPEYDEMKTWFTLQKIQKKCKYRPENTDDIDSEDTNDIDHENTDDIDSEDTDNIDSKDL
ncbi:hypothetical protein C1646_757856 [Rhizophagus diaphanus]|nr:hypothetical protein C1646_757856 [Rhizophagus diaphanus] [Rhizophagus sp. MUCL 43196]